MQGQVVIISKNHRGGKVFGIIPMPESATCGPFPIDDREAAIRLLDPGQEVEFITARSGEAEIIFPPPMIGCRGGRERAA